VGRLGVSLTVVSELGSCSGVSRLGRMLCAKVVLRAWTSAASRARWAETTEAHMEALREVVGTRGTNWWI
jgi:hypothetical protein